MRVLWICNIIIPVISESLGEAIRSNGGWLTGTCNALTSNRSISLAICFPYRKNISGIVGDISYYGFKNGSTCEFKQIIQSFNPDVVHIWGTESVHSMNAIRSSKELDMLDRTVVSIQGLVSIYARHYYANLPSRVVHGWTIRDLIKYDNIARQKRRFEQRGKNEIKTIRLAKHVIGRTDWDRACVEKINSNTKYHFCNEILRDSFYANLGSWKKSECLQFSIFVSQAHYPIKGFHYMLEAFKDVLEYYPNSILYTTGVSPYEYGIRSFVHRSYYNKYIRQLLNRFKIRDKVVFLGNLNEKQMCERFLKSHVFVSCSSIENSPNSLGEAMLLGVPVVSSDVGGVKNMVQHNQSGFVYPYDEPYMCAYYIKKIFDNEALALKMSREGSMRACEIYDRKTNLCQLMEIYRELV